VCIRGLKKKPGLTGDGLVVAAGGIGSNDAGQIFSIPTFRAIPLV
jgi:hypothetical protein